MLHRARPVAVPLACLVPLVWSIWGCAPKSVAPASPPAFDTATVWIHQGGDSASLLVEVAETHLQHEIGLSGRARLDADSGMLFRFDAPRSGDDGFWMWRTAIPLDIAFLDGDGRVVRVMSMAVCEATEGPDSCPGHFPGVAYASAIEANAGWFTDHGLGVGARVILSR